MKARDFSPASSEVIGLSRSECFRLGDLVVCTEHLLLALLQVTPAERLEVAGIDRAMVIARVEEFLAVERQQVGDVVLVGRRGAQTPRVKMAIEIARARASADGRDEGLCDLWNGLLSDAEARAVILLAELGHDAAELLRVLG